MYPIFTDTAPRLIAGCIYMTEHSYGGIDCWCDELLEDLKNSGHDTHMQRVKDMFDNLNRKRGEEFTRRQWITELRKMEQSL